MRVYADGSRIGTGHGGWAWASEDGREASGSEHDTTNQRMELTAALEAVRAHSDQQLTVVTDSAYVVNCFIDKWWVGWLSRGWVSSSRKPVANRDLWEPLIMAYQCHDDVTFEWVKGHNGDAGNERADTLAQAAARALAAQPQIGVLIEEPRFAGSVRAW